MFLSEELLEVLKAIDSAVKIDFFDKVVCQFDFI